MDVLEVVKAQREAINKAREELEKTVNANLEFFKEELKKIAPADAYDITVYPMHYGDNNRLNGFFKTPSKYGSNTHAYVWNFCFDTCWKKW